MFNRKPRKKWSVAKWELNSSGDCVTAILSADTVDDGDSRLYMIQVPFGDLGKLPHNDIADALIAPILERLKEVVKDLEAQVSAKETT